MTDNPVDKCRILIADDSEMVREGTKAMLKNHPDLCVIAEAKNGLEAVALAHEHAPDLVLMDIRMPGLDGFQATRRLKEKLPEIPVLVVTSHAQPDYVVQAIQAGAAGYVLKEATEEQLVKTIHQVLAGETPLDADLVKRFVIKTARDSMRSTTTSTLRRRTLADLLTDQEIAVLGHIAQGMTNAEIAQALFISPHTVKGHVEHIIAKLGVSDRTQAAVKAAREGLLVA